MRSLTQFFSKPRGRATRGVHQNAPHEARGHRKEMRAILPLDLLDFDQPEIRLIDQRGSLERVAGTFVAHMAPRQAAQLLMDEGQQAVERCHITPPPGLQQSGGVVRATGNAAMADAIDLSLFRDDDED